MKIQQHRKVYGLFALGESLNGWPFKMFSRNLFTSPEAAVDYENEFMDLCCDNTHLECAERGTLTLEVVEYRLNYPDAWVRI